MGVHPCRAAQDTFTNPHFKMHAYTDESIGLTLCGLEVRDFGNPDFADWRFAYASICPSCFPREEEDPGDPPRKQVGWDDEHPHNVGDVIGGRWGAPPDHEDKPEG